MTSSPVGFIARSWLKWKSLKLPWRRRRLAGTDLAGNTFWEIKDTLNASRLRRIAQCSPKIPYSDIQISPQWHQWLRHTRPSPPTIQEQQSDLRRQSQLRYLAQQADERWAAKPSLLDPPSRRDLPPPSQSQPAPPSPNASLRQESLPPSSPLSDLPTTEPSPPNSNPNPKPQTEKTNPWKVNRRNPGEEWQPQAWTPGGS